MSSIIPGDDHESTIEDLAKHDIGHVITLMPKPIRGMEQSTRLPYRAILTQIRRYDSTKGNMPVVTYRLRVNLIGERRGREFIYFGCEIGPYPGTWPVRVGELWTGMISKPLSKGAARPIKPVRELPKRDQRPGVVWTSETPRKRNTFL